MSPDLFDRRRAERFAQLLDAPDGVPRHHTRGSGDTQLAELVSVGNTLTRVGPAVPSPSVDPEFRTSLRAMLVATAEREGVGAEPNEEPVSRWRAALGAGAGRRVRARGAIVIGVAVGAVAVSSMSFASEDAVPGDALYGVKRSTEKAQLALAGSDVTRGQLFLGFARNRLTEASAVPGGGLDGVFADMDADSREGVRLLNTAAVQRRDEAPLDAVDAFVSAQRRQLGPLIDRLGAADRKEALASLELLDDVDKRVRGLRNGFECGPEGVSGADSLGPRPRSCSAAQSGTGTGTGTGTAEAEDEQPTGTTTGKGSRTTEQQDRTTSPSPSPATGGQKQQPAPSGSAVPPSTAPGDSGPQQQDTGDDAAEDEDVLDRIFGGLVG